MTVPIHLTQKPWRGGLGSLDTPMMQHEAPNLGCLHTVISIFETLPIQK
jgi:hypothetical protein